MINPNFKYYQYYQINPNSQIPKIGCFGFGILDFSLGFVSIFDILPNEDSPDESHRDPAEGGMISDF